MRKHTVALVSWISTKTGKTDEPLRHKPLTKREADGIIYRLRNSCSSVIGHINSKSEIGCMYRLKITQLKN